MTHVVVGGAGITGLVAAHTLRSARADLAITVLEADRRVGGVIRTSNFGGRPVDEGADAFILRAPWAKELCEEVGLGAELVSPSSASAYVYSRNALRRLPEGLVMGVPTHFGQLARSGIVSKWTALRAGLDLIRPDNWPGGDESVGDMIGRRLGRDVAERLVDPLVGGINAGNTDNLSVMMTMPQIALAQRHNRSLILGLRAQRAASHGPVDAPIFAAPRRGMESLVARLARLLEKAPNVEIRTETTIAGLDHLPRGRIQVDLADGSALDADAVILTIPAYAASHVVRPVSEPAAEVMASIDYAGVAMATLAFRRSEVEHPLDASGALVARPEGLLMTACSFASSKWPHWSDDDRVVLRISAGRHGDERALELDDEELIDALLGELATVIGGTGDLLEWRVTRWPRSFPQYEPGHLAKVSHIARDLARDRPGLAVAGAAYRGLGIPSCINQGQEAAQSVLEHVAQLE